VLRQAGTSVNQARVFCHIVTYNSVDYIGRCLSALLEQENFCIGDNLHVEITDNASVDATICALEPFLAQGVILHKKELNCGFCGAHNEAIARFMSGSQDFYLMLNPDLKLERNALWSLVKEFNSHPNAGAACPRLYLSDHELNPQMPLAIDSAGIYMTPSLRHFDRGQYCPDDPLYHKSQFVFGGSGACLILRREFIKDIAVCGSLESNVERVYPQMALLDPFRLRILDEAFFAYREDADLAWRGQLFGWKFLYAASAVGYHKRKVTPKKRQELAASINRLGVKNRFLLQINNYHYAGLRCFFGGIIFRNLLVVLGVIFSERKSLPAFKELGLLYKRARERRKIILQKSRRSARELRRWFCGKTLAEDI